MAKKSDTTDLMALLLRCMGEADPMLGMLEWLRLPWRKRRYQANRELRTTSTETIETAAGADIVRAVTIPGWKPCTCWVPKSERWPYPLFLDRAHAQQGRFDPVVQKAFVLSFSKNRRKKMLGCGGWG